MISETFSAQNEVVPSRQEIKKKQKKQKTGGGTQPGVKAAKTHSEAAEETAGQQLKPIAARRCASSAHLTTTLFTGGRANYSFHPLLPPPKSILRSSHATRPGAGEAPISKQPPQRNRY